MSAAAAANLEDAVQALLQRADVGYFAQILVRLPHYFPRRSMPSEMASHWTECVRTIIRALAPWLGT